jgi:hypothetical protein
VIVVLLDPMTINPNGKNVNENSKRISPMFRNRFEPIAIYLSRITDQGFEPFPRTLAVL